MRRGFKTEAKSLALELRAEIGLDAHAPFDPYTFASEYGIPVVQLSDLDGGARDHFLRADGSALSGALIPNGSGVVILENDAQPLTRRRTTMCHELAHVVLEHKFGVSLSDERKCGLGGDQEAEADWLSRGDADPQRRSIPARPSERHRRGGSRCLRRQPRSRPLEDEPQRRPQGHGTRSRQVGQHSQLLPLTAIPLPAIDPRSARVRRSLPSCPARAYTRR
ncbi:ImmA/IrrE family metallo-endopeptidase [Blastococcus sp. TML/C7B]|uniref:ImmA/IrrE family metallo-endopeptidase n=1 Tax=Blastococcus sp. TML/C7B TaxID=2798728 RepID=UPI00190D9EBB|nr:ImmA/IrrE family metallo-endopeptidase [Blastococcus sp. TML/C7B]